MANHKLMEHQQALMRHLRHKVALLQVTMHGLAMKARSLGGSTIQMYRQRLRRIQHQLDRRIRSSVVRAEIQVLQHQSSVLAAESLSNYFFFVGVGVGVAVLQPPVNLRHAWAAPPEVV